MVGGVSIGAFIGALWCMHRDTATVTQKAREWSKVYYQFLLDNELVITNFLHIRCL